MTARSAVACLVVAGALAAGGTVLVPQAARAASAATTSSAVTSAPAATAAPQKSALTVNPANYPYANTATNQQDPWGFVIRQCTSYAAWWLNANGLNLTSFTRGPAGSAHFVNASGWAASAAQAGWAISSTPQLGAIAQWNAGETSSWDQGSGSFTAGSLGHVAVVTAIDAATGLVTLNSYNVNDSESYAVFQGVAPRYLLIGFAPATAAASMKAPVAAVVEPVTRSVTGVVIVYDSRGRRTGISLAPVVIADGRKRVKARLLPGGGFHATLPAPGPWRITAQVKGVRCTATTVAISSARPAKVLLVCRVTR